MTDGGGVLVTRPEPEALRTAERLAALGYRAIVVPLMTAEAIADRRPLTGFAAVAVTSARTIGFLTSAERHSLAGRPAFAVGSRTAEALRAAGLRHVRSSEGDVAALAALIAGSGLPAGAGILHVGGEERAGDLAAPLIDAGLIVEVSSVYRMVPRATMPSAARDALITSAAGAVLHYSPRSARLFCDLASQAGLQAAAAKVRHICLSEQVAEPLRHAFGATLAVARRPDEQSLLEALRH